MTKLSYYLCVDTNAKEHLLYGTSKKEVIQVGEKMGLGNFTTVEEQNFVEMKKKFTDKQIIKARKESKDQWVRKITQKISKA